MDSVLKASYIRLKRARAHFSSSNIPFFPPPKCLISVWSRQYISAKLVLWLFEALLLSVGISGSQTVTRAHNREKKELVWRLLPEDEAELH